MTTTRPCPRRYSALTCSDLLQYTIKMIIKMIITYRYSTLRNQYNAIIAMQLAMNKEEKINSTIIKFYARTR